MHTDALTLAQALATIAGPVVIHARKPCAAWRCILYVWP